jgi:hypothetical protein
MTRRSPIFQTTRCGFEGGDGGESPIGDANFATLVW